MAASSHGSPVSVDAGGVSVRLTSPEREMFPGITKRKVLDYYLSVAGPMVAQVGDRPTALERWPDGVGDEREHFFQKHLPKSTPDYVSGLSVRFPSGRRGTILNPDSAAVIAWAVQMSAITFHAWPVRAPSLDKPDQLRIDLDPSPGRGWRDVLDVALMCRELLSEWEWPSYVKTSGSRGVHIFIPIRPDHSFINVRHAAIVVGRELERRSPDLVTTSWWKEERGERVFIDYNQNAQDRLMASAYSLRPKPDATVSMPVEWDDLPDVDPHDFTLRTVPALVRARARDPWSGMQEAAVSLEPALERWERGVREGLPELPYPPDFPKMPGEPPRVQPSRARTD